MDTKIEIDFESFKKKELNYFPSNLEELLIFL